MCWWLGPTNFHEGLTVEIRYNLSTYVVSASNATGQRVRADKTGGDDQREAYIAEEPPSATIQGVAPLRPCSWIHFAAGSPVYPRGPHPHLYIDLTLTRSVTS
jgi:hypothetical protein